MIPAGRRSKLSFTSFVITSSVTLLVPKVLMLIDTGFATPIAYAIGVAKPVSISINTFGTNKVTEDVITKLVNDNFDLRPAGIIKELDLRRPIYAQTAAYGHFGRTDVDLPWEHTDKAETLRKQAGL